MATTAENVVEGQEVTCSDEIKEFHSAACTDISVDPSALSVEEKKALEDAFRRSYNMLSFSACDGFFRVVSEAEILVENLDGFLQRRKLQGGAPSKH